MTDNEIIKALECCVSNTGIDACINCPFNELKICERDYYGLEKLVLDLINRQKAEIERLTTLAELGNMRANDYRVMRDKAKNARAEAIKEFAERLKANYSVFYAYKGGLIKSEIDNLVKEMTEDSK